MKRTALFTALLAVGVAAFPLSASALVTNNFVVVPIPFTNAQSQIGNSTPSLFWPNGTLPTRNVGNGLFQDNWIFQILPAELVTNVVIDLDNPFHPPGVPGCDATHTCLQEIEWVAPMVQLIGPSGITPLTRDPANEELWYFSGILAPGQYDLQLNGQVLGSVGGSYGGTIQAGVVPEPETYAMLLAGLGLVGLIARRRNPVA